MQTKRTPKGIAVRLVYRNYKSLRRDYAPLAEHPPQGVTYVLPRVRKNLAKLLPLYRNLRYFAPGRAAIRLIEKKLFLNKPQNDADLYHYVGMIETPPPAKPYVVDIEHAAALLSFTYSLDRLNDVKSFLENSNCKAINCYSQAANRTLKGLLGDGYEKIRSKVNIVYPSPVTVDIRKLRPDYTLIENNPKKLKVLAIGNRAYLKGFEELLVATKKLNELFSPSKLEVHIVSNDANEVIEKYQLENVHLYPANFSEAEMISKFYLPADVFVSPTRQDTYGMAILESLHCGTPVIATSQFAIPELVTDGVDGILIKVKKSLFDDAVIPKVEDIAAAHRSNPDQYITNQLVAVISKVLQGKVDVDKLGLAAKKKFSNGNRFDPEVRRTQLRSIYRKALNLK